MTDQPQPMTIGKLADALEINIETIRFYQREGLIKEPAKRNNGFRYYGVEHLSRIMFIKKAKELGFSLAEIKELLELNTKPRSTCANVKQKTMEKMEEIDQKIEDLKKMKKSLEKLSCACDSTQDNFKQYKVQDCFEIDSNCKC